MNVYCIGCRDRGICKQDVLWPDPVKPGCFKLDDGTEQWVTEYLRFVDRTEQGAKTRTIEIQSLHHGDILGFIKWNGAWRQYWFMPEKGSGWSAGCMEDVTEFINTLMDARKKEKKHNELQTKDGLASDLRG